MEFIIEREREANIIGIEGRMEVAMLLGFPDPLIRNCTPTVVPVRNERGIVADTEVLLLADNTAYKVERRILKETIYGSVHCGFALKMEEDGTYFYDETSLVAVKRYVKETMDNLRGRCQEDPFKEWAVMQFLGNDHPNVMGQLDCLEDPEHFYSIMPFCRGGELFDHMDPGGMTESKSRKIFTQILDGLAYMHSRGVAHRDMSLENLLIENPEDEELLRVIIIDFGMAIRVPRYRTADGWTGFLVPPMGCCGKKNYIAPEVILNARHRTARPFNPLAADIWGVGAILFMLLTERPPFNTDRLVEFNYDLTEEVVNLIEKIRNRTPGSRPSIAQMRAHPWMMMA